MSYKSSNFRRGQESVDAPKEPSNVKVRQLQEMFPSWSDDDLKSLLQEVNFDVELAATRISEGHAEQWGAVTRKKDKRAAHASSASTGTERGSSRGVRGGRGGARGGRGGGGRGVGRGGHRETNGRHAPSPAPQASGWASTPAPSAVTGDAATSNGWGTTDDASDPAVTSGWGDTGASSTAEASSTSNRGKIDATPGAKTNGAAATPIEAKSQTPAAPTPVAKPAVNTPATSKMSWAQIAKPQEKPKVAPTPAPAPPTAASSPAQPPAPAPVPAAAPAPEPVVAPEPEQNIQPEAQGWEEPTTAQAPTWDDEPSTQPTVKATADGWITSVSSQTDSQPAPAPVEAVQRHEQDHEPEQIAAPSAFPAQLGLQTRTDSSVVPPAKPSTPVSYARAVNSRAGNRFKVTDQAVIMPSTFGSVEKLGMQFGSVSLGGDDADLNAPEPPTPEALAPVSSLPEPVQEPQPQATHAPPAEPAPAPASKNQSPLATTHSLFQQAVPQQNQTQQVQPHIQPSLSSAQQAPPSLLPTQPSSQSALSSQATTSTAASTPLTSFSAQQQTPSSQSSVSPYQQHSSQQQTQAPQSQPPSQSHLQQQQQSQLHQQFSHFPSHLDQPTSSQSPPQSQQTQQQLQQASLQQGTGSHGSYYRQPQQPEQSFHHASTPPAGQAQETQYGSFAPLSQQLGYQTQNSQLGGFNSDQFGYNDAPRGFYDSYGQQSAFGARNALGHDDLGKSLPGAQQGSQTGAGLPQSAAQSVQQQQATQQPQSAAQPQGPTAAGQPQQGYAPVPYYYNMYQPGQYYGPPYGSGYGLGQYGNRYPGQQPPMFQPGNPTSASPANAKGPNSVPPQSNPYAPGLYGQQHASTAYEDGYGHHGQLGPQHNQGVGGLSTNDYGKPLYGGQGIQSFMGQSSSPAQLGQRGTGTGGSPENSYKPYGPNVGVGAKDVGGTPGVGPGITGAQGALGQSGRGGVQQPQHSQFYGANRFSSNPGTGGPPGQQGGQQQSQGYPQGGADNAFYYQRTSQNGPPYWG